MWTDSLVESPALLASVVGAGAAAGAQQLSLREILGFVPAVIFPLASLIQLLMMVRRRSGQGVSVVTWSLFVLANLCLYIYMEKYLQLQAVATTLGTAAIQIAIVVLAVKWRKSAL